jgi:hypothetical protein
VKLVTEYLTDAIKFDQMADDATDVALKRAKQLGMPPPAVSLEPTADEA